MEYDACARRICVRRASTSEDGEDDSDGLERAEVRSGISIFDYLRTELMKYRVKGIHEVTPSSCEDNASVPTTGGGSPPPELSFKCGFVGYIGYEADELALEASRRSKQIRLHGNAVPGKNVFSILY